MPPRNSQKESELIQKFGHHVSALRKERGITQIELAERAVLSVDAIKNIEQGRHGPTFRTIEKLALALEVPLKELFHFSWPSTGK